MDSTENQVTNQNRTRIREEEETTQPTEVILPGEPDRTLREVIETWFIQCGTPSFVTSPEKHLPFATRVLPVLGIVYLLETFTALNSDRSTLGNILWLVAAFGILIGAVWLISSIPGAPWRVGAIPFSRFVPLAFVVVPGLIAFRIGEGLPVALFVLAVNGTLLFLAGYGWIGISKEAGGEIARQLKHLFHVLPAAAPLLLLFLTFLFVQAEVWQTVAQLDGPPLIIILLLFPGITTLFASAYVTKDVSELAEFDSWEEVRKEVKGTVAERLSELVTESEDPMPPLSRSEERNASILMRFAVMLRSFAVGIGVSLFFVGFGSVLVTPEVVDSWMALTRVSAAPTNDLWSTVLWGRSIAISEELIQVSLFMGAFSGMYFSWFTLSEKGTRKQFFGDIDKKMRQLLAARALYKSVLWDSGSTEEGLSRFGIHAARFATDVHTPSHTRTEELPSPQRS